MRPDLRVHVALLFVQLAFASGALAGKLTMNVEHVDPTALALMRAIGGAAAFHVARVVVSRGDPAPKPDRSDHLRFALFAVLGVVINQAFFLHGLKRGTASSAALLAATIPVFTAAVAAMAKQEKLATRTLVGIGVASVGVLVLTGVRDVSLGNLLVTINSMAYAAYLVGVRPLLHKHGPLVTIAWVFTYGALMLLPFGARAIVLDARTWSPRAIELVAWFVAVPTVFAYLTNAWALGRAKPSVVAAYIYLQPLLVLALAGKLLGEKTSPRTALAGAAILLGVGIVATRRPEPSVLEDQVS